MEYWEAVSAGDVDALSRELAAGVDPNSYNMSDFRRPTALHLAAQSGHAEAVRVLLAAGAHPMATSDTGATPLHWAKNAQVASLLVEAGAYVDARDSSGNTPLIVAAMLDAPADEHEQVALIEYLLSAGATPFMPSSDGNAAIHWAAFTGAVRALDVLAHAGSPLDVPNAGGQTPLIKAVMGGRPDSVRWLMEHGANRSARSVEGWTPLDWTIGESNPQTKAQIEAMLQTPMRQAGLASRATGGQAQVVGHYTDGRPLTYDQSTVSFAIGGTAVSLEQVLEYDAWNQIQWPSAEMRNWAHGLRQAGGFAR